ncbi:MAG TPA: GGDEF domain-containing protein [Thermoanaerobaculia bacterium]|nr:GGDEF domain-containing protein [Thermoanaerobaculia bacterium]
MTLTAGEVAALFCALTAGAFGLVALTLLIASRSRLTLGLYAALALAASLVLALPLAAPAAPKAVATAAAVLLALIACLLLFDLRRGSRRTRAFVFAAASCLLLAGLAEIAQRHAVLLARTVVPPIGAGFIFFTVLLLPTVVDEERRLFERATTDPLTGLLNRSAFRERARSELARAERTGRCLSLAMLDIDHFKAFNDAHGHPAGDAALSAVAGAISRTIRAIDLAGRYGGEEFVLLLVEADAVAAVRALERLRKNVAGLEPPRIARPITISAGIAVHEPRFERATLEGLVSRADATLYAAKEAGRNKVMVEGPPRAGEASEVVYR